MRSSRNLVIAALLVAASVLGLAAVALGSTQNVEATVRLDDLQTGWPDHVPVQQHGVEVLDELIADSGDIVVAASNDNSTIGIVGPGDTDPTVLDQAVADLVAGDGQPPADTDADQLRNELATAEAELVAAVDADPSMSPFDIASRVDGISQLRGDLARARIERSQHASRYRPLSPATPTERPGRGLQIAIAVVVGAAGLAMAARELRAS